MRTAEHSGRRPRPIGASYAIPLHVIKDMLTSRVLDFCTSHLPGGRLEGHEWVCGGVDGGPGRSMAVAVRGAKAGTWADFAGSADHRGDVIDLVRHVRFGGDKGEAIKWAIGWLGLADTGHEDMAFLRARAREKAKQQRDEADAQARSMRQRAFAIWGVEAHQQIAGTPVERYLAGRGVYLDLLPGSLGSVRFHPALFNRESNRRWPAMVMCILNGDGKFLSAHRTWLEVRPDGRVEKAPLAKPKMVLGLFGGGYIPISKGRSGLPMSRASDCDEVLACEGGEDAMTLAMACPQHRVIAGVSLDNLAAMPVPVNVRSLTIIGDNDEGAKQRTKLAAAVDAQIKRGIADVRCVVPSAHKDVNELHLASQREKAT